MKKLKYSNQHKTLTTYLYYYSTLSQNMQRSALMHTHSALVQVIILFAYYIDWYLIIEFHTVNFMVLVVSQMHFHHFKSRTLCIFICSMEVIYKKYILSKILQLNQSDSFKSKHILN